jgi:hypothetical protein
MGDLMLLLHFIYFIETFNYSTFCLEVHKMYHLFACFSCFPEKLMTELLVTLIKLDI